MTEEERRPFTFYVEVFFWVLGLGGVALWLVLLILVALGVIGT